MQKIQMNLLIGFNVSIIHALNGVSLIQISTIWMNQDTLLVKSNVQKSFFLLKKSKHLPNKMAIVNGQHLLNAFASLEEIFHPFLLLRVNISLKIYVIIYSF